MLVASIVCLALICSGPIATWGIHANLLSKLIAWCITISLTFFFTIGLARFETGEDGGELSFLNAEAFFLTGVIMFVIGCFVAMLDHGVHWWSQSWEVSTIVVVSFLIGMYGFEKMYDRPKIRSV